MDLVCAHCSAVFHERPSHAAYRRYCSRDCMATAYKTRLRGSANPNHRGAPPKTCLRCGGDFFSSHKGRRYCSQRCARAHKVQPRTIQMVLRLPAPPRVKKPRRTALLVTTNCDGCGVDFAHHACSERRYCSYPCFVKAGGPFRAGLAAAQAMRKYGAKKDANHAEIIAEMRKHCPGVYDMSDFGCGVPDGLAWVGEGDDIRNWSWQLFDVKNPKTGYGRRGLNAIQRKWLSNRGGPVYLIYTIEEARAFAKGRLDGLKREGGPTPIGMNPQDLRKTA